MTSPVPPTGSRKILYLASAYGFSEQQRSGLLAELVSALEKAGAEVWEPFARNNTNESHRRR